MAATSERIRLSDEGSTSPTSPTSRASSSLLKCDCGRAFTRVENLRRHQRSHEDSRRLACPICSRTFNRPDVLKRHLRTHRGPSIPSQPRDLSPRQAPSPSSASTSGRQTNNTSPRHENELPPPNFPYRDADPRHERRHHGDLPPIESLLPRPRPLDFNSPMPRLPPAFPVDTTPLPLSHMQQQYNDGGHDHSLFWSLQDTVDEIMWSDFGALEKSAPASNNSNSGFSFFEALRPTGSAPRSRYSDGGSPPLRKRQHGDIWGAPGAQQHHMPSPDSGDIMESFGDPALDPKLWAWSRFWLDEQLYAKVKSSLNLAQFNVPGQDLKRFRMPESLFTVNTFISTYFHSIYSHLPILHLSTFSVDRAHPLLLAGIICLGASTAETSGIRPFAVDLVEVIRRTLTELLENDPVNLRNPSIELVQSCLLNCLAGVLVAHKRSFELAELTRSRLIQLARKLRLFHSPQHTPQLYASLPPNPADLWLVWIDMETRKRLGLGIYLVDSLFPVFLDIPASVPKGEMLDAAFPCDERFWAACNPDEWKSFVGHGILPPTAYFVNGITALTVPRGSRGGPTPIRHLNQFGSMCLMIALHQDISDLRSQLSIYESAGVVTKQWRPDEKDFSPELAHEFERRRRRLEDALDVWRDEYYDPQDCSPLAVSSKALYHLGHILIRFNLRDLPGAASGYPGSRSAIKAWGSSMDSPAAARHAARLLAAVGFPGPLDNALAAPMVFIATLVLWAFLKGHGPAIHPSFDTREIMRLFESVPSTYSLLRGSTKYMVNNKRWKLGQGFALVLARMMDLDEAPSSPPLRSPQSAHSL